MQENTRKEINVPAQLQDKPCEFKKKSIKGTLWGVQEYGNVHNQEIQLENPHSYSTNSKEL